MTQQEEQKTQDPKNTVEGWKSETVSKKKDSWSKKSEHYDDLIAKISQLEKELTEQKEITKRAQYDYINLKADFDRRQRLKEEEWKTAYIDTLIVSVQKFLPFVESLRKSLETIPTDQQENALAKGVQMTYNKFVQTLESMKIKQIEAIWLIPDGFLHEPVSAQAVDDEKMKGKIVTEFEKWFVYDDGQTKKVITTSKVVIGQ
jgi:molecular chaperone GrpE (heat shock protein)